MTGSTVFTVALVCVVSGATAASTALASKGVTAESRSTSIIAVVLTPIADTYADQALPSTNFGTVTNLDVQSQKTSRNRRSFVRFDLSSIPSSATVHAAQLDVTMYTAPTASRSLQAQRVSASWTESTLTWTSMPAISASIAATAATGTTANTVLQLDLSGDTRAMLASPATNFGWQLADATESSSTLRLTQFRSRDFATGTAVPHLTVTYSP